MTVADQISILSQRDPLSTVVLRDAVSETGFVEARSIGTVTLRAYSRKGMCFLGSWNDELPVDEKTDIGFHPVHGVLIE